MIPKSKTVAGYVEPEVRSFIAQQALDEQAARKRVFQPMSGSDVATLHSVLEQVDDELLKRQVVFFSQNMTKYRFIEHVLDERGDLMKQAPGVAATLAAALTERDVALRRAGGNV